MSDNIDKIGRILKDYDRGRIVSVNDQSHGYANINYRVVTTEGELFIRFCKQQALSGIEQEMLLMNILKEREFKTAYPVKRVDGNYISFYNGLPVVIYEFVAGVLPLLNIDVVGQIARAVGGLSEIEYPEELSKANSISLSDSRKIIESAAFLEYRHKDVTERFESMIEALEPRISIEVPGGIVHCDIFPDNTLFQDGTLVAIIDFEEFAIDNLLFDVGMTINGFCFNGIHLEPDLLKVFLIEYNKKRALNPTEKELLIDYMVWGAVGMTSWHLHQLLYLKNLKQLRRVRVLLERAEWVLSNRQSLKAIIDLSL